MPTYIVLKGGTLATATNTYLADVGIQGGSIAMIGQDLRRDRVLNVTGTYVFPGPVDPHTHLELEFMDTVSSDDFYTGTVAAGCGGTTTIIDHAEQQQGGTLGQAIQAWRAEADSKAVMDHGLHVSITDARPEVLADMANVVREDVSSFKCYLAYPERLRDDELLQVFLRAREISALVNVHCENGWLADFMASKLLGEG